MGSDGTDPTRETTNPQTNGVDLEFLYRAIETSMHAVIICDLDLSIEWVNSEFLRKFNLDDVEAATRISMRSLLEAPENVESPMLELMETGRWQGELRLLRSDNSAIDALVTATILPNAAGIPFKIIVSGMDITEEKQVEKALAQKTMLLDSILQSASDIAIATTDLDLRITYYNPMAEKLFGYTAEEVIGRSVMEMHMKEKVDPERLERAIETVRSTGEYCYSITQETDEGPRYLESRVSGIFNSNGELAGFSLFSRDVTERKLTEEALEKSREEMAAIIETMPYGVMLIGEDRQIRHANAAALATMGYSSEDEIVGRICHDTLCPAERDNCPILDKGERLDRSERVLLTKDGEEVPILKSAVRMNVGGKNLILEAFVDLTERKKAEEAMRESEERFRQVADNAQEWIWEVDCQGLYTYGSPVIEKILGYKPEEIVGYKHFYDLFHPDDREELKKAALHAFTEKQTFSEFINRNLHKNGRVVWMSTSGAPILDENGNLLGYRGADTDITDRKRLEEQVRHRLIALTQPEVDLGDLSLTDIVGVDMLQRLQDAFADAFNMPTIIYGSDGAAITQPSRFTPFCNLVRSTEDGATRCEAFDSKLMGDLRENHEPRIRCSCALNNIVTGTVPILIQDRHLANWSIGQMLNRKLDLKEVRSFAKQIGLSEKELVAAAKKLILVDDETLEHAVAFLSTLSEQISLLALQNLQQGRDIAARREAEEERVRLLHDTNERVKELRCMYGIAESIRSRKTLEQVFEDAVLLIPTGWQYPEITRSRIRFDDQEFDSQPFEETEWQQSADIVLAGEARGTVEVFYLEERSELDEGPFLKEERNLLEGIARALSEALEREHAQKELGRLATAIDQAAETVVITDAEGTIQYVNPAFERITGYSRMEAIGQNPRILQSGKHDDIFYRKMWDTLTRGETWSGRFINRKKDETFYTEEVTISPVHDSSGETVNYVAVKRDITEEIRLENQLQQAQKMEAVGQLAGGVAHDFNNLLQVINGYTEMALRDIACSHPAHGSIKEVARAGDRARTLVNQLLSFSRRQIINPIDLDLNEVIFNLMKMIRRVIGEHIKCDFIPGRGLGTVHADRGQMEQVLMNLCVNSRDAMPDGGSITIETGNVLINGDYIRMHQWARPGRFVLLSITDTGFGMDDETLNSVFDPFFTTKEVGKGTGLGLSTVYGIVKQHDGDIQVYSEIGKGTIFKVYLSAVEHRAAEISSSVPGPAVGGTETILVAEDDDMVRNLTVQTLERAGYTVLNAGNGEEAVRLFEAHADEIALAVLDVVMPGLGGRQVHDRIKEIHPHTRVLFSSGYSHNAIHTSFILDECLQLIQKPYGPDALIRRVREVLDS